MLVPAGNSAQLKKNCSILEIEGMSTVNKGANATGVLICDLLPLKEIQIIYDTFFILDSRCWHKQNTYLLTESSGSKFVLHVVLNMWAIYEYIAFIIKGFCLVRQTGTSFGFIDSLFACN
jgi:hypothetical protein